jgi:hypothetical protein
MEANKTDKLLDFIRAALASGDLDKLDAHNMAKAADMTVETARASLVRLRRQGVITHEPRDFKTLRIVGETPKRAAPAKKKSAPKASKKKTEPEAASATGDGLEQARTVIYTDDEVARLDALVEKVSELVGALAAIVRDIRNTPHNGPDRAQLVRILAKLPAAG